MAGKEYTGKDITVQKMTRDGLTEENLHDGTVRSVSQREREGRSARSFDTSMDRRGSGNTDMDNASRRNKKYRDQTSKESSDSAVLSRSRDGPVDEREGILRTESEEAGEENELTPAESETESGSTSARQKRLMNYAGRNKSGNSRTAADHENPDRMDNLSESRESSYSRKLHEHESLPEGEDLKEQKAAMKKKQKQRRLTEEQKKAGRLNFGDEENGMVKGQGTGVGRKAVTGAVSVSAGYLRGKLRDESDDNAGVDSASAGEQAAEDAARSLREAQIRSNRTSGRRSRLKLSEEEQMAEAGTRLKFGESETEATSEAVREATKKKTQRKEMNRFFQRKRYKDAYKAARSGEVVVGSGSNAVVQESIATKAKRAAKELLVRNRSILIGIGIFALLFIIIAVSISSCASSIQGGGSLIGITTYPSTDDDIYAAENAYEALEEALNRQINNMESEHPGYDEYRYNISEITHNPYHLISYLTAKYGGFTYADVEDEIQALFEAQYSLTTSTSTETTTETRTVRVGESLGQVVTSGYCNCSICCGQWAGGATASGVYPTANHTIAVDATNPTVPMGTKVVMNGVEYTVEDTGAFARYGVDFDVYYDSHSAASAHGHQTWEAYIADDNGSQEVTVTDTTTKRIFTATLTNSGFDAVARANLTDEQQIIYDALNTTLGNRDYLWDVSTISTGAAGDGMSYDIPPEALSDERFRNMITEAEKYLGYPYVWGGSSPSTSFDCSGFVSWVVNHCGNGWSYGRLTADGLRSKCTYVSPSEAKPGDLIFFQHTYDTSGASHVGIYVGNGMMIHCGDPIHYSNINTSYWQEHFLCFGRLP